MQLRFEGAVAGVVPVIRVLQESLAAAHVERIHGIVNGTTNFILTEMARGGRVLRATRWRRAQELGYAEADPTDDVTGRDAAAKMAILARLAFATPVHLDQVTYEGIEQITADDIEYARDLGLGLKLIGTAERVDGGDLACACTRRSCIRAIRWRRVNGPFNAVTIESDAITEITLSGPGAGGPQTASAVLGDVISAMIPPASTPETTERAAGRRRRRVRLLPAPGGRRPARRARPGRRGARHAGRVDQVGRAEGPGRQRAARDGPAPAAGVALLRRGAADRADGRSCAPRRARSACIDEEFELDGMGLIERYRERLPFAAGDPVVSLEEGSTPLVLAERAVRARRRRGVAEARGREPDRLVQGPRDDVRGVRRRARGRGGGDLRLDRQHRRVAPPPTRRGPGCAAR